MLWHTSAMATRKCLFADFRPDEGPGETLVTLLEGTMAFAESAGLATGERQRLAIVVEELASNAARHGTGPDGLRLSLTLGDEGNFLVISLEDDGLPFDPTTRPAYAGPDPQTGGGVGLELVRAWCEDLSYQRGKAGNQLRLKLPRQGCS